MAITSQQIEEEKRQEELAKQGAEAQILKLQMQNGGPIPQQPPPEPTIKPISPEPTPTEIAKLSAQEKEQFALEAVALEAKEPALQVSKQPPIPGQKPPTPTLAAIKLDKAVLAAVLAIEPYKVDGGYDLTAAIKAGVPSLTLKDAGFGFDQIAHARAIVIAQSEARIAVIDARLAATAEEGIPDKSIARKTKDVLKEGFTFGKVETETFNRDDLSKRYDALRESQARIYNEHQKDSEKQGIQLLETKEQFIDRSLGPKETYIQQFLDAQPSLIKLAKETGLASIPIYGTIRTWDESPNWLRALSVAGDIATFIPVVGQVSALRRAGTTLPRIVQQVAVAEAKAPFQAIRHPLTSAKATIDPLLTFVDPRRIPTATMETRAHTIRFEAQPKLFEASQSSVRIPKAELEGINPFGVKAASDIVALRAIRGETAEAALPTGARIQLTTPALQRITGPAAFNNTPDIRNWIVGTTIQPGKEKKGLFVAPQMMTRFIKSTATGVMPELTTDAKTAIALGKLPDKPIQGTVLIRDPKLLDKLKGSGKLYEGAAEVEQTLPPGTVVPPPSQFLITRAGDGTPAMVAVIGKPLTPVQIARLKLVGPSETVAAIFRKPGKFERAPEAVEFNRAQNISKRAESLALEAQEAKKAGNTARANELFQEANEEGARAARLFERAQLRSGERFVSGIKPAALYFGDQDINKALERLAEKPARAMPKRVTAARPTAFIARPRTMAKPPRRARAAQPPRRVPAGEPPRRAPAGEPPRRVPVGEPPAAPPPGRPGMPPAPSRGRFELPTGEKLKLGVYPRVVAWRQGKVIIALDLDTGQRTYTGTTNGQKGKSPAQTFRVRTTDRTPPKTQDFRQGFVSIRVTPSDLKFKRVRFGRRKGM
ncbi:MAG: hypothetical protein ACREQA_20650 [Candidatus Binatia bacterium]